MADNTSSTPFITNTSYLPPLIDNTSFSSSSDVTNTSLSCDWNYPTSATLTFIIVGLLIIIENAGGILVIYTTQALHSTANIFVCSMAVTDIAAGLACVVANVFILVSKLNDVSEHVATYGLMIMLVIFGMVILSCAHMAIISIERYLYIAHPFFYIKHVSQSSITRGLKIFWVCCAIYTSGLFITYFTGTQISLCDRQLPNATGLIFSFVVYYSSMIISCVVYLQITRIAMNQKRLHDPRQRSIRMDSINNKDKRKKSVVQKEKMLQETLKTLKFFILVFGIFLVFTLPPACMFVVDTLIMEVPNTIFRLSTAPAVLNSGVNFVVLTVLNKHFKNSLKSKLGALCMRN